MSDPNPQCHGTTCKADTIDAAAGRGDQAASGSQLYRCRSCFGGGVFCCGCMLSLHQFLPFHRLEHWNGSFFVPGPLKDFHQLIHLGHGGLSCPSFRSTITPGVSSSATLTVLHVNGYHRVDVHYCCCTGADLPYIQLLRVELFPATHHRPATVFTFELLKHFQNFNLASKTAAHDYHKALMQLTDAVLPISIPVSGHHSQSTGVA